MDLHVVYQIKLFYAFSFSGASVNHQFVFLLEMEILEKGRNNIIRMETWKTHAKNFVGLFLELETVSNGESDSGCFSE